MLNMHLTPHWHMKKLAAAWVHIRQLSNCELMSGTATVQLVATLYVLFFLSFTYVDNLDKYYRVSCTSLQSFDPLLLFQARPALQPNSPTDDCREEEKSIYSTGWIVVRCN